MEITVISPVHLSTPALLRTILFQSERYSESDFPLLYGLRSTVVVALDFAHGNFWQLNDLEERLLLFIPTLPVLLV